MKVLRVINAGSFFRVSVYRGSLLVEPFVEHPRSLSAQMFNGNAVRYCATDRARALAYFGIKLPHKCRPKRQWKFARPPSPISAAVPSADGFQELSRYLGAGAVWDGSGTRVATHNANQLRFLEVPTLKRVSIALSVILSVILLPNCYCGERSNHTRGPIGGSRR